MKYIFKNLLSFFTDSKLVAVLAVISIFVSSVVINFSYGIYQNYNVILENNVSDGELVMSVVFMNTGNEKGQYVNKKMFMECVDEIAISSLDFNERISVIAVDGILDNNTADFRFGVRDGHISISDDFAENSDANGMIKGDYWGDIDEIEGNRVALCYDYRIGTVDTPYINSILKDEDTLIICGMEYKIIGYQEWNIDGVMVPINSVDDDTYLKSVLIMFDRGITKPTYECISKIFKDKLGDLAYVVEISELDVDSRYTYKTVIIIAVLTALIAAFNFMILYRYILSRRQRKTAIYRLCGLTVNKASLYNLVECILITVPVYLLGLVLYDKVIMPYLDDFFPYMRDAYTDKLYLCLFTIYLAISVIVCSIQICVDNHKKILVQRNE